MIRRGGTRGAHGNPGGDGFVMLVALFALVVLVTATALVAASLARRQAELRREVEAARLVALLDAATAYALAELAVRRGWRGVRDEPLGGGRFDVDVATVVGGDRVVTFTAHYAGRRRQATARVVWVGERPVLAEWRPLRAADRRAAV